MSVAKTYTAQIAGVEGTVIVVEADISNGLHAFSIVGLGDRAVEESKDRVSAAIKNSGYVSPKQKNQKVVISLAPADLKKEGPSFDLAIAMVYLLASGEVTFDSEGKLFLGELSLEGKLRPGHGTIAVAKAAQKDGFKELYIAEENAQEASLISGIDIYPAHSLKEIIDHVSGSKKLNLLQKTNFLEGSPNETFFEKIPDFSDIFGQENAKRGLEIAAAGQHNVVMYGPPGTGKTMLAKALVAILPDLSYEESIEVTSIYSVAKVLNRKIITRPPFRAPHHTSSYASLIGGGNNLRPGEITLAHKGVLFLDEFPEFDRRAIDALRQPLEEHTITISRSKGSMQYPAHTILVAAMNPCSCGYLGNNDTVKKCICTDKEINRYKKKISGPIADRIDLWIPVLKVDPGVLSDQEYNGSKKTVITSTTIRRNIASAREFRKGNPGSISNEAKSILILSAKKIGLSGRGFNRTLAVARTIADLDRSSEIKKNHILEALQYRQRDF